MRDYISQSALLTKNIFVIECELTNINKFKMATKKTPKGTAKKAVASSTAKPRKSSNKKVPKVSKPKFGTNAYNSVLNKLWRDYEGV